MLTNEGDVCWLTGLMNSAPILIRSRSHEQQCDMTPRCMAHLFEQGLLLDKDENSHFCRLATWNTVWKCCLLTNMQSLSASLIFPVCFQGSIWRWPAVGRHGLYLSPWPDKALWGTRLRLPHLQDLRSRQEWRTVRDWHCKWFGSKYYLGPSVMREIFDQCFLPALV